jgi:acyl-CoA thioester hydrolase
MTLPKWFDYPVQVQPHHTDYAGIVWHGTYIAWMEEARIEYLRSHQLSFTDWINAGIDLPVVDLSLRYRQSLPLGAKALVRSRVAPPTGARIVWHYDIQNQATQTSCVQGTVTLVPVELQSRRILRRLPPEFEQLLRQMADA